MKKLQRKSVIPPLSVFNIECKFCCVLCCFCYVFMKDTEKKLKVEKLETVCCHGEGCYCCHGNIKSASVCLCILCRYQYIGSIVQNVLPTIATLYKMYK